MPRVNDGSDDDDSTDSGARRAARRAADEIRRLGGATRDVEDPGVTDGSSSSDGGSSSGSSSDSSSGGRGATPDDVLSQEEGSNDSSSTSDSSSGDSSGSSSGGRGATPDDINAGRRSSGGSTSGSSSSSTDSSTPSVTDTRSSGSSRSSGDSSGSSASGSSGGSDEESPVEQVRGTVESNTSEQGLESEGSGRTSEAARELEQRVISQTEGIDSADQVRVVRDGDKIRAELTSQGDRSMQDFREDQVAQQVIESTEGIDERSEVDVIQRGDSFEARLTDEGEQARRQAVEQNQRDAIADMGTTGRSLLARQAAQEAGVTRSDVDVDVSQSSVDVGLSDSGVERAAERQAAAFASDVRTNQFARQQLREEFASQSEDLDSSDVDLDVTRSSVGVGLTEGGENRRAVASAAENSEFTRDELTATVTEDGETSVQLTDEALVERVAGENEDVSRDDLRVVEREFQGASERRPGFSQRTIELTDDAAAQRRLEQARDENPNANFALTEGEDGTPRVEVQERFDDDGRFLLIPGGESVAEDVADATGDALRGVGGFVGEAALTPNDFIFKSLGVTEEGDISGVGQSAGAGFADLLNVPQLLVTADEAGEFIGAAGAAGTRSLLEGNTDELAEFGQEGTAAGTFLGTQVADQATSNPVQFGARLGGALLGSAALFRLSGPASSTSGQLARGIVQPGEELFFATAGRGALSRSALRARASSATDRLPDVRTALRGDTDSSVIGGVDPDLPGQRFTLDADATDAARGVSGPGRIALARGRIRRALSGVRRPSTRGETDAMDVNFRGDDRAQAELDFGSRPESKGSDVPESFTDFDGGAPRRGGPPSPRDDVLEGSPRDQISDDIADRARTQRRQNAGTFDGAGDVTRTPGGFSRRGDSEVNTRLRENMTSRASSGSTRPFFGRVEGLNLLEEAQDPQVQSASASLSGVEDTSLTTSFTGMNSALGLDAALGQSPGLELDGRPIGDEDVATRPRGDSDTSPLEDVGPDTFNDLRSEPSARNDTDGVLRGDTRLNSALDSRSDTRTETRTDTRSDTRSDTRFETRTETTTETDVRTRFGNRTESERRRNLPNPDKNIQRFADPDGLNLEASEDLFSTGFADFDAEDL